MLTDNLTLIWERTSHPNVVQQILYSEYGWLALLALVLLPLVVGILIVCWWPHRENLQERITREERTP